MFLVSLWLEIYRFLNCSFYYFEQFKDNIHFANSGQLKMDPICSSLLTLDRSQLFYWVWTKHATKNGPKNSRTTHRIWHKSFSVIQSAGIKNWFPQSIIRLQGFTLVSSCNWFFWFLWQNKMFMIRIKMQKVLQNWGNIF